MASAAPGWAQLAGELARVAWAARVEQLLERPGVRARWAELVAGAPGGAERYLADLAAIALVEGELGPMFRRHVRAIRRAGHLPGASGSSPYACAPRAAASHGRGPLQPG